MIARSMSKHTVEIVAREVSTLGLKAGTPVEHHTAVTELGFLIFHFHFHLTLTFFTLFFRTPA
jgi:hypothetical protein